MVLVRPTIVEKSKFCSMHCRDVVPFCARIKTFQDCFLQLMDTRCSEDHFSSVVSHLIYAFAFLLFKNE